MRIETDESSRFAALYRELQSLGVRIGECAAHWRGSFYYLDNTYGGGLGLRLGPLQSEGITLDGKPCRFYNAMGHGFALAGRCGIGEHLSAAFERIALF